MCIQYTQIQIFHPLSKNKDPTHVDALEIRWQTKHHHWDKNCQPQPVQTPDQQDFIDHLSLFLSEMSMKSPNR